MKKRGIWICVLLVSICISKMDIKASKKFQKADQYHNEQDQTAAESELDQADKDTRCQSSLLKARMTQYAPSQLLNFESQFSSF